METLSRQQAIKATIDAIEEFDIPHPYSLPALPWEHGPDPLPVYSPAGWSRCILLYSLLAPRWQDGGVLLKRMPSTGTFFPLTPFTHPPAEHYHDVDKFEELIHIRYPDEVIAESDLVWKPCKESSSSIYPFRRVTTSKNTYFISMFGEIYNELTAVD